MMGFPHCPICIALAFIYLFIGVTRTYMFFILFRNFVREESNFNFRLASLKA